MNSISKMIWRVIVLFLVLGICGCKGAGKVSYTLEEPEVAETVPAEPESAERQQEEEVRPVVYVCGAVVHPGVYELESGSRIYQALEAAGGLLETADLTALNQADVVYDGQQILVLTLEEAQSVVRESSVNGATASGKVNLNHADKDALMTLPGIGEAKAESILAYRAEMGGFSSVEELMNISGIKQGVFNKIKDQIEV